MKKIIRLTETDLLRYTKRIINERLGVPDNITEAAHKIYDEILNLLPRKYDLNSVNEEYSIDFYEILRVGEHEFNNVDITIATHVIDNPNFEVVIMGAHVESTVSNVGANLKRKKDGPLIIQYKFAVGPDCKLYEIMSALQTNRPQLESMMAHELFHKYEHTKKDTEYLGSVAKYKGSQNVGIQNVDPINKFMHLLYYVHEAERYTRPSELYSMLKYNKVTKSKFKHFFNETDIIKKLKECRDYSYSQLITELRSHMEGINVFLEHVIGTGDAPPEMNLSMDAPDDEKIQKTLELLLLMFKNETIDQFIGLIKQVMNPFKMFINPKGNDIAIQEKQKHLDVFIKKMSKYDNAKDFFGNEIKRLNFVGDQTIKKLSKLYDMVDNDENSIVNWDLHHKINKTAEKSKLKLAELFKNETPKIDKKKKS